MDNTYQGEKYLFDCSIKHSFNSRIRKKYRIKNLYVFFEKLRSAILMKQQNIK